MKVQESIYKFPPSKPFTSKEVRAKIRKVSVYAIPGLNINKGDINNISQLKSVLAEVVDIVCEIFEIDKKGLLKVINSKREFKRRKCTTQEYSDGMHTCVFIIHQIGYVSLARLGSVIGKRDHSTMIYAIRKIDGQCEMYSKFRGKINTILYRMGYPQLPKKRWSLK